MRGAVASPNTVMMSDKGIEGITPDNDFINKLLCPEPKGDGPNKKGPAKAFLTQLAHKAETRWAMPAHLNRLSSPNVLTVTACATLVSWQRLAYHTPVVHILPAWRLAAKCLTQRCWPGSLRRVCGAEQSFC